MQTLYTEIHLILRHFSGLQFWRGQWISRITCVQRKLWIELELRDGKDSVHVQDPSKHHRFVLRPYRLFALGKGRRTRKLGTVTMTRHFGSWWTVQDCKLTACRLHIKVESFPYGSLPPEGELAALVPAHHPWFFCVWISDPRPSTCPSMGCASGWIFVAVRQTRCSSFGWSFSVALIARQGCLCTRLWVRDWSNLCEIDPNLNYKPPTSHVSKAFPLLCWHSWYWQEFAQGRVE
jgi:hypothetical protein